MEYDNRRNQSLSGFFVWKGYDRKCIGHISETKAHRLSTTRLADRIIMLEHGRIVEQGSHQALLEKNGKYAQMWRVRAGGIGCPYEHWRVHALRERDGIPELSLVAETDHMIHSRDVVLPAPLMPSSAKIPP